MLMKPRDKTSRVREWEQVDASHDKDNRGSQSIWEEGSHEKEANNEEETTHAKRLSNRMDAAA